MSIETLTPPAVAAHAGRPSATLGEAAVVLGLPIGVFAAREFSRLLTNGRVPMRPAFSDTRMLATLGVEVLLGAVLIWWLRRRGWQPAVSVGRPAFADVPRGTVLWIATFAVTTLLSLAVSTSILPVGVIWTSYFLWRRRLWPVVVAHIINNAIGLSAFLIGGD